MTVPAVLGPGLAATQQRRGRTPRPAAADPADCAGVREDALSGVVLPPCREDDEEWLAYMLQSYLDEEWMEQPVHARVGQATARLYGEARAAGDDDLIAVLARMSYGLKDMWNGEGFAESFEGPIDVANRAAEFIMLRLGRKVWSYGRSNDEVQQKMMQRIADYEERQLRAPGAGGPVGGAAA